MSDSATGRPLVVYERVAELKPGQEPIPAWCNYFLVDDEGEDVYVTSKVLSGSQLFISIATGAAVQYPRNGPAKPIRGRVFVSAKELGRDDPRFDQLRQTILQSFRNCTTVVDNFD